MAEPGAAALVPSHNDVDPMTYVSEAMRASLVPGVAHMNTTVCFIAICAAIGIFGTIGIRGFLRRAVD